MIKVENPGKGIIGKPEDGEPGNELEHFHTCTTCGQAFDVRDLGQLIHHGTEGHKPITPDA